MTLAHVVRIYTCDYPGCRDNEGVSAVKQTDTDWYIGDGVDFCPEHANFARWAQQAADRMTDA